jgi:hypothetical protein
MSKNRLMRSGPQNNFLRTRNRDRVSVNLFGTALKVLRPKAAMIAANRSPAGQNGSGRRAIR